MLPTKHLQWDNLLLLGFLFAFVRYDYLTVITDFDMEDSVRFPDRPRLYMDNSQTFPKEISTLLQTELYVEDAAHFSRWRSAVVGFNAEITVLTPKNPVRVGMPSSSTAVLQNVTSSALAFNAAAEALGDLFMRETYLQNNLDLDEITAVAGVVTKEDLDVQMLVDVLWSQEVDLGASREWMEYAVCPPSQSSASLSSKENEGLADPQKTQTKLDPYYFPAIMPQEVRQNASGTFIDSETGELVSVPGMGMASCSGNDTHDPGSQQMTRNCSALDPSFANSNVTFQNGSSLQNESIESRQLQSLIQALDSLNSSTMHAEGQLPEERWEDVQSVITHNQPAQNLLVSQSAPNQMMFQNGAVRGCNSASSMSQAQNSTSDIASFDLFSMFMGPPTNWSLPALNNSPPKMNMSEFLTFPSAFNGSIVTTYNQNQNPTTQLNINVSSNEMFAVGGRGGGGGRGQNENALLHEGPFDLSAFSYSQIPLQQQQQIPQQNFETSSLSQNHNNFLDWSMADWNATGMGMTLQGEINDFQNSSGGMDYLPALNSSGNILPMQLNASSASNGSGLTGNDWKILQDFGGASRGAVNSSEVLFMLDEAKMHLMQAADDKPTAVVPSISNSSSSSDLSSQDEIKEEEMDPWTEHVSYALRHNHSYAQLTARQSRAGSEEGRMSMAGSSGSHSNASYSWKERSGSVSGQSQGVRSRHSRSKDDRAASHLNLPVTAEEIVNMPVEEFNNYIATGVAHLQAEQVQLMKDIRRRGKNKVAAQNCRRRKIDNMSHLEREIMKLRSELSVANAYRNRLVQERESYRAALAGTTSVIQTSPSISSAPSVIVPLSSALSSGSGLASATLTKRPPRSRDLSAESAHALRTAKRKREE